MRNSFAGDEPDWQPETLEGLGSGKIAYCGRSEFTFNCDPYVSGYKRE